MSKRKTVWLPTVENIYRENRQHMHGAFGLAIGAIDAMTLAELDVIQQYVEATKRERGLGGGGRKITQDREIE